MGRVRIFSTGLVLFVSTLAFLTCVHGVENDDYYESLKDDDEVRKSDVKESVTEYPNGVNVIPGEAEIHYPIYDKIPKSAFSCAGRPTGFYADTELRCQVWHICDETGAQQSFLCTNGTTYSQEKRVCDWWYNVNCDPEEVNRNYEQNRDLYKGPPSKSQEHAYEQSPQNNDIPTPRKSSPQPRNRPSYDQQQQRRTPVSDDKPAERRPSDNQYTEPEEYQERQSQRNRDASQNNNRQDVNSQSRQRNDNNQQQRTPVQTQRPTIPNGPQSQTTPVPEKKRVIVLRLPGPLPPGATIPPHVLREYAESVLAAERAGKTPPTGLSQSPRPNQPRQDTPRPTSQAPQRPPQAPSQRPPQGAPLPPIVSAPFKPVVPYTPRPFSQFLEQASRYNGQTRPQQFSPPIEKSVQQTGPNTRTSESRPQVDQRSTPAPSRQAYEEPRRPSPTPSRQSFEEPRRSSTPTNQDNHNERRPSEHPQSQSRPSEEEYRQPETKSRQPQPQNQNRQPENQNRQTQSPNQNRQNDYQNSQADNQQRQPQNQNRQTETQSRQSEAQDRNRQTENSNRQADTRNKQPENQYRQPQEQPEEQHSPRPAPSNPSPEKKVQAKVHKAPAPPADPHKKFRHSTPRKHVNVKFAPKGPSSFEENEDERQFPEESRRPAYPFQFNNFHSVPHHISSAQDSSKEDVHIKSTPVAQEKPRRRPQEFLKESFVEYKPTTVRTTEAPVVQDPVVHKLVVVARKSLKIKDPNQETTTTTEKVQEFRRMRYESVKVQYAQPTTVVTPRTPTTTQAPPTTSTSYPMPITTEDTPKTPGGTRRIVKVKKLRPSTTTEAFRETEDLGFDIYGRNPDEDEEEELIRAAQLYQEASEHYGKRRRPSK